MMSVIDKYFECVSRLSISVTSVHPVFQEIFFYMWFGYRHEYYRHELNTSVETFYEHYSIGVLSSTVPKWKHANSWHGTTVTPFSLGYVLRVVKDDAWTQG